jgi:hypothetical protein
MLYIEVISSLIVRLLVNNGCDMNVINSVSCI